jgi:hypothetical protein
MHPTTSFAAATDLTRVDESHFAGDLSPAWTVNERPNGGYLLAMMARAAVESTPQPHVLTASAHYVRPPQLGHATFETEVLRVGNSASQVRVRLLHGGHTCVESLITTGSVPTADTSPYWSAGVPEAATAPWEQCIRVPGRSPTGMAVALAEHTELRIDPATFGFAQGNPSGSGELRGWLRLPDDEPFDPFSLVFAVDAFPPGSFEVEVTGWVPTLELTVYVRALPVPGPVRILQKAQLIDGQRFDEACFVWDSSGRLVAQGTQLAGIRLG